MNKLVDKLRVLSTRFGDQEIQLTIEDLQRYRLGEFSKKAVENFDRKLLDCMALDFVLTKES